MASQPDSEETGEQTSTPWWVWLVVVLVVLGPAPAKFDTSRKIEAQRPEQSNLVFRPIQR